MLHSHITTVTSAAFPYTVTTVTSAFETGMRLVQFQIVPVYIIACVYNLNLAATPFDFNEYAVRNGQFETGYNLKPRNRWQHPTCIHASRFLLNTDILEYQRRVHLTPSLCGLGWKRTLVLEMDVDWLIEYCCTSHHLVYGYVKTDEINDDEIGRKPDLHFNVKWRTGSLSVSSSLLSLVSTYP